MTRRDLDPDRSLPLRVVSVEPTIWHPSETAEVRVAGFPSNRAVSAALGRPGTEIKTAYIGSVITGPDGTGTIRVQVPPANLLAPMLDTGARILPCLALFVQTGTTDPDWDNPGVAVPIRITLD